MDILTPSLVLTIAGVGLTAWIWARSDVRRIKAFVTRHHGQVRECKRDSFAHTRDNDSADRIYLVTYVDLLGQVHTASCKISPGSGVYVTEDKVIEGGKHTGPSRLSDPRPGSHTPPAPSDRVADLEREVHRPNARVRELEKHLTEHSGFRSKFRLRS